MSTRGSIAIVRQRYRRKRQTREPPEHVGHPGVADHVGLDGEDERRAERGSEPGLTSKQYAEDAKAPRNPDKPAEQAGLHPELRVVRLARLDRRLRPRRRLARVAQAETLRVVDDCARCWTRSSFVQCPVGATKGKTWIHAIETAIVATAAAAGHQRRKAKASTTSPAASASSDERENVKSSAAAATTATPASSRTRRRSAAASSSATTSRYADASGLRNSETRRRRKRSSEPVL